ncbi:MAG: Gfo/Idh/MocA family oxidoreductase [Clostridia bacterium]|nr:Gfo/Idh/MocA family oxidoreductase [Clostridia bacterium]
MLSEKKLALGIVGVGRMGLAHINNYLAGLMPSVEITAAADTDPSRRTVLSEKLPGIPFFDTAQELYGSGLCSAVLICTPHYLHPPLAVSAFDNGIHVLSEKPAGVYSLQVKEAIAAAESSGLVYGVMYNQRTNSVFKKVRELVRSGEYGPLRRVSWIITDWFRSQAYYDMGQWRATWSGEGGGVLMNQCVHQLDLLQWICGMPEKITATCREGKWHDIEVEDEVFMFLEYPGGATGTFITSTAEAPGTNRLEITLDRAKITVNDASEIRLFELERGLSDCIVNEKDGFARPACKCPDVITDGTDPEHPAVVEAFAQAVLHGTELVAKGEEGINTVDLINAAYLSSWTNSTVTVPVDPVLFKAELDKKIESSRRKTRVTESVDAFEIKKYK